MKTFTVLALLATVASAQLPNIPTCALQCFLGALTSDGCSSLTDFACHCSKTDLIPKVQPCIQTGCSAEDQAAVMKAATEACAAAGVPIAVPAAAPPAAMTPAPAAEEAPAASIAATEAPMSTDAYGATIMTTTTRTSISGVVVTATLSSGMAAASYSAGNATGNATSATPASFTGAAERRGVAVGGLVGLFAGVIGIAAL
ncbi:hypothetical protein W97_00415 [Coniosporium apollinis CBS 100218]|uniref:CFEM domain-containing protein n=1 Tax=Coniosporium apollinis (strain CBS 100218) TaxID=1168221 RepID=R7YH40_CONA1|nr:uncharacterized protein W97_00415 [Coniosporium apollinis CBS 100218]EON61203.1 hypothetical protein W97_00415 [Coniosporium apollinis CBS 100218]